MLDRIEVGERNNVVICPLLFDGRIEKLLIRKTNKTIYICEECESIWESFEDIVSQKHGPAPLYDYFKGIGVDTTTFRKEDWDKHIVRSGFLSFEEIGPYLKSVSVEFI